MADEEKPKFDGEQLNIKIKDQCVSRVRGQACRDTAHRPDTCASPVQHLSRRQRTHTSPKDGGEVQFKVKKNTKFAKVRGCLFWRSRLRARLYPRRRLCRRLHAVPSCRPPV